MTDHYETLGVARDASPDDIKAAWRREASKVHPDREGGSTTTMAAVNKAYEVLSDPERRANYDTTGKDELPAPIDMEARTIAMATLSSLLDAEGNIIDMAKKHLQINLEKLDEQHAALTARRSRLQHRRDKTTARGTNLVHMLIDQQLTIIDNGIAQVDRGRLVLPKAIELVEEHILDEPGPLTFMPGPGIFPFGGSR